jgi:hypothetical protein
MKITYLPLFLAFLFSGCVSTGETTNTDAQETGNSVQWQNWYLSVPLNRNDGKATSLYYEDVINNNLSEEQSTYFYPNEDGSYTLYTHFTGYTTSGQYDLGTKGKYCRTELREFYRGNQSTDDNWSMDEGTHLLESTLQVEYCSPLAKGSYVAQIHGVSDDYIKSTTSRKGSPATVKVLYQPSGVLKLEYYIAPPEPAETEWSSKYIRKFELAEVGNEIFTIKIKVEKGVLYYGLTCEAKDIDIDFTEVYDYGSNGYNYHNYFKTGNYFGYNKDGDEYAQVILHGVKTSHE